MKKTDRLACYGWPALAVIILFSLFAGLLFLPGIKKTAARPSSDSLKVPTVRYAVTDNRELLSSEERAEVRALYASDLFASSIGIPFSELHFAAGRLNQTNIVPPATPLFLPFAPVSNEMNPRLSAINTPGADNDADDLPLFVHPPKPSNRQKQKKPEFSIELRGELKRCSIDRDVFQGIFPASPAEPMLLQAQMRVNGEGRVEQVLAESTDCAPAIYQEIVKRLYQCRFGNVTKPCEGTILISYPAYKKGGNQ